MQFTAPYSIVGTSNLSLHIHPAHLADLRASGLTDDTIRAAGVYSLHPRDIALFFNLRQGVPEKIESALCFPYRGGTFARIKLFPALGKMKYAQPPNTSARLYMPFAVSDRAVYLCEGEKKTLAAHQAGLHAVGIGGVWSWLSNGQPIDDLILVEWDGLDVTVIPDSDVFRRGDLLRAIYALGCELRAQGASVYVAEIPQPSGAKIGLDDFLVGGGRVDDLEIFNLGHRIFKGAAYWHGQWKFKKALEAA